MSYHQDWASRKAFPSQLTPESTSSFEHKIAILALAVLFGALALNLFESWTSIAKRLVWEAIIFLTPSRLIYVIESFSIRYGRLDNEEVRFRPEDFGSYQAKCEALRRLFWFDDGRITNTLQRVRAFTGISSRLTEPNVMLPAGLGNWDNSCYQNSILQGLASLPAFGAFVGKNVDYMDEVDDAPTHHALHDVTTRLNATASHTSTMWTPSALKSMDSWQQQDAQEYFSKVLDAVDEEFAKSLKKNASKSGFETNSRGHMPASKTRRQRNPLEGLQAQRVACRQCGYAEGLNLSPFNCLTVNLGLHHNYDLEELLDDHTSLEIIEGVECTKCTLLHIQTRLQLLLSKPSATDGLDESADSAKLRATAEARLISIRKVFEDDLFSESGILKRCNVPAKAHISAVKSKQVAVARPPKDLVIHLNRSIFDDFGNQRKNTANVRFPPVFDLGRWCLGIKASGVGSDDFERWSMASTESMLPTSPEETLGIRAKYQLRCVVTHYGRHENGHYVAYGKRRVSENIERPGSEKSEATEEQWYCFNDEIVSAISEDDVLDRGNVFMLFYEAMEPSNDHPPLSLYDSPMSAGIVVKDSLAVVADDQEQETKVRYRERRNSGGKAQDASANEKTNTDPTIPTMAEVPDLYGDPLADRTNAAKRTPSPTACDMTKDVRGEASKAAPAMRTSSASSTLSRKTKRQSSFNVPSPSAISAI